MTEQLSLAEISAEVLNTNFTKIEDAVNAKAELNGDSTQKFKVADAIESTEAINKGQLDNSVTAINTDITELETVVATKADKTYVDNNLLLKANTADVEAALTLKADKTYVDTELATKADLNGSSAQIFNVADAITSTQAINKGQLDSAVSTISNEISTIETEIDNVLIDGYKLPDYANAVNKSWNTSYTAECDGELYLYSFCNNTQTSILINNVSYIILGTAGVCVESGCFLRISKGDVYRFRSVNGGTGSIKFIPLKGAN